MTALLDLEPLASTDELTGLDELFFGDDSDDAHDLQNCYITARCGAGSHTQYCITTY
ncbi:MAG: hypothetical protein ACR2N4_09615 [Jatrophihabitans sp.]